jgi:gamma-carbonic anhydrase
VTNTPLASSPTRPGVTLVTIDGVAPTIADSAFIAPGCVLAGNVTVGEDASIWYNCVVRADVDRIVIGARSNIQDGSVLHCDMGYPLIIGDDVLVGHMVLLHGCTLENRAFVGLSSIVMNGCIIAGDGMLAAGAMLTQGKHIGPRELWGGSPARKMRDLDDAAVAGMRMGTAHYVENAKRHRAAIG